MISDECSFKDYEEFFKAYIKFRERKKRDNDYNPLLVIRKVKEEVRLHSRFLHSFLDTEGWHYQEDLFLEPFLECLGLKNFFKNTESVRVRKEYNNIDLHLSYDKKHLIIENKIYAGDGDTQISRYIKTIKDKGVEYENIAVVYLSPYERTPSQESLNEWSISGKWLVKKDNEKIIYKNATYKTEILKWIEKCQKKCKNISNLYMSFEFYKECVKILIGEKKMGLEEFLKDNKDKREKFIKIIAEIKKQCAEELSVELFKEYVKKDETGKLKDYKLEPFKEKEHKVSKKMSEYYIICHNNHIGQTFKYVLTLESTGFNRNIGFRLYDKKGAINNETAKKLKAIIEKSPNIENIKINQSGWWLANEKGEADLVDLSNESLEEYFEKRYEKVELLNDFLKTNPEI